MKQDPTPQSTPQSALDAWRADLTSSALPVFSRTVREVSHVATSRATSASDLAEVVGRDASMTARIIQIANSPMFNVQNKSIETIDGAIVLVGFNAVRDLAISVAVIEQMLQGNQHARVGQAMARAFHAAAQARSFADHSEDDRAGEVFVAALLKQVGAMAFWSKAGDEAQLLEDKLAEGEDPLDAERDVLGFTLDELSQGLVQDWKLGELLADALDKRVDTPQTRHVRFGHELAQTLEAEDWQSPRVQRLVDRIAKDLDLKSSQVAEMVCANIEAAGKMAERFGVPKIEAALPTVPTQAGAQNSSEPEREPTDSTAEPSMVQASDDAKPQLTPVEESVDDQTQIPLAEVLSRLSLGIEQQKSRDELMQQVVGGMCGLGFDVAYFALLNPQRTELQIKYRCGDQCPMSLPGAIDMSLLERSGVLPMPGFGVVSRIVIAGKPVGLVCAETQSQAPQMINGFRQLAQQINLILTQAAN